MLLCAGIRWRLRDMPLERDEGEYAYVGQLMLQGVPPYQLAYNMKLPGTYAAYAVTMAVFGQTAAGIRIGLLLVNACTTLLIYAVACQLIGRLGGAVAGVSYGVLSIGPGVNGFAAHATHFVVLAAAAGLWLLLRGVRSKRVATLFFSGLCMGLAFVMKQPGALYGVFGGLFLVHTAGWSIAKLRPVTRLLVSYTAGCMLPYGLTCLILWHAGVFNKFWFWTVDYAAGYGSSWGHGWLYFSNNVPQVIHSAIALWILACLGLLAVGLNRKLRDTAFFVFGLLFFSGLAVSAGFYFRFHYFILLLPALSLLIAAAVASAATYASDRGGVQRYFPLVVFVLAAFSCLLQQEYFFFRADPVSASRHVYPTDPFPEAAALGGWLRDHSAPGQTIAVLGSEPQILFYARRRSATGYLYSYSLMEEQKYASAMQREAIGEVEAATPAFVVFAHDWMILPHSDMTFLRWSDAYLKAHYELIGVMRERDAFQLRPPSDVATSAAQQNGALFLYRRKTS